MTYLPLPDGDQALISFLTAHPVLAPMHGGRVGTALQSDLTSLRVTALGGVQPWPWEGTTEYQLEAWGGSQGDANLLIRTALAAVYELLGPIPGGRVTGVAVTLRPVWAPDEQTGRARYLAHVQFTVHPEET